MDRAKDKENLKVTLQNLLQFVGDGDIEETKKVINCFHTNLARNKQFLSELYTSDSQCTTQNDLILAACQNNQPDTLYYLLNKTDILVHLTDDSFDATKVNEQMTKAFEHALQLEAFHIVEMLYDYWCGNLHWIGQDIEDKKKKIDTLGSVLKDALNVVCPNTDEALRINFHSLITFNEFQREIYAKLDMVKSIDVTPKYMATMLLKVLRVYDEYSHLEKVRIPITQEASEQELKAFIEDKSSRFHRNLGHILYEAYFRKLDFNVSLLILEDLNVLRKHLKERFNRTDFFFKYNPKIKTFYDHAAKSFEKVESAIYHFMYRTNEDWRLYLPEDRNKTQLFVNDGHKPFKVTLDAHKVLNGPVIFYERKCFKKFMKKFKKLLRIHVICREPAGVITKSVAVNKEDINIIKIINENYLQTIIYMSDHYSLKKIVNYIEAIENTNEINVLMIERVVQVMGEMLKSTDDSRHLSRSTQAFLQIAMSVETVSHLHNIRNYYSHANKGKLSTRIDMAGTQTQIFVEIKQELIKIKQIINAVLEIYKSILDESLLAKGFSLLEQRLLALPREAKKHLGEILRLELLKDDKLSPETSQFFQDVWSTTGLSFHQLTDIAFIMHNGSYLFSKRLSAEIDINSNVMNILPSLIEKANQTLGGIIKSNDNVEKINNQLTKYDKDFKMCDNPDGDEIYRVRSRALRMMKRNKKIKINLTLLDDIKHYKNHWDAIKEMLAFCFKECKVFHSIIHLYEVNKDSLPDTNTVKKVKNLLAEMKAICVLYGCPQPLSLNQEHFSAIKKLYDNTVAKKTVPTKSRIVRQKLILCLIIRLNLLKDELLSKQKISFSQQIQRFTHDDKFRTILEMILADIANVLDECDINLMNKSSKLLRDIDLGNVLDHGNPFLEEIGDFFNSHDLSAELLEKAVMFAKDAEPVEALYELFKDKIVYETILEGDLLKMNPRQRNLFKKFSDSPNWKVYTNLVQYQFPRISGATSNFFNWYEISKWHTKYTMLLFLIFSLLLMVIVTVLLSE